VRAVSKKRARQLRAYRPARDVFLAEHARCQFPADASSSPPNYTTAPDDAG